MEIPKLKLFDIGFIMGFVIGEASFTGDKIQPCLSISLHEDDPYPLQKIRSHLGGQINGPYHYERHDGYCIRRQWMYLLRGPELRAAFPLFYQWLPPSRKRDQMLAWMVKYEWYWEKYPLPQVPMRPYFQDEEA
jgi:hypothetical protein